MAPYLTETSPCRANGKLAIVTSTTDPPDAAATQLLSAHASEVSVIPVRLVAAIVVSMYKKLLNTTCVLPTSVTPTSPGPLGAGGVTMLNRVTAAEHNLRV